MTIVECVWNEVLKLVLFLPRVKLDPSEYDVSCRNFLTNKENDTMLTFE